MVNNQSLTGVDREKLLLCYKVTRKHWKQLEWKKNWWKYVKWDPPSSEKWTDEYEKKIQDIKSTDISFDGTAYDRYKTNLKQDLINSINGMSEEELTDVQRKLDFCLK